MKTSILPILIRSAAATVVGILSLSGCSEGSKLLDPRSDPSPVPSLSVAAAAVTVSVRDDYFTPDPINPGQGGTVQWNFDGFSTHTATDNSGMGLFDSGLKDHGETYSFTFKSAGRYPYVCTLHDWMTGTVRVPVKVAPVSGSTSTTFTVAWSSTAPSAGYVFDVQIKRPASTFFHNWKTGQTVRSATFTPDAGAGGYSFRARLRKPGNNTKSQYSFPKSVTVS